MYMKGGYLFVFILFLRNKRALPSFCLHQFFVLLSSNLAEDNAGEADHACEAWYGGHATFVGGCWAEAGNEKG